MKLKSPSKREGACTAPIPNRFNSPRNTPLHTRPQLCDPVPLVCGAAPIKPADELWVVTRPVGTTDPIWAEQYTIIGSPERIRSLFDLSAGILLAVATLQKQSGTALPSRRAQRRTPLPTRPEPSREIEE